MQTLHVSIWGGPSMGKTSVAQQVSGELKRRGYKADYVPEFAKELVRQGIIHLYDQIEILAEQHRREKLCHGALDVVVTDSPLPLSLYHCSDEDKQALERIIDNRTRDWTILNYFVERDLSNAYETEGRYEDVNGALAKHKGLLTILQRRDPGYTALATAEASDFIVAEIVHRLSQLERFAETA